MDCPMKLTHVRGAAVLLIEKERPMRTYLPATQTTRTPRRFTWPVFAVDKHIALYTRQSAEEHVLTTSEAHDEQTAGLATHALALGWDRERIAVYRENERNDGERGSPSGRLHPGLRALTLRHVFDAASLFF